MIKPGRKLNQSIRGNRSYFVGVKSELKREESERKEKERSLRLHCISTIIVRGLVLKSRALAIGKLMAVWFETKAKEVQDSRGACIQWILSLPS